ncbi:hypothetical protein PoB_000691300 [Plakobranchus ocellatus]|uniref:Uncharacterized protein n=1 Tax=Plakobranchus ocellatus TaxID=259542 RepID=A0AAV3YE63_9GAST|nr:hypothetical protein PoB_000691300 [Plakobranchus ocellatus]
MLTNFPGSSNLRYTMLFSKEVVLVRLRAVFFAPTSPCIARSSYCRLINWSLHRASSLKAPAMFYLPSYTRLELCSSLHPPSQKCRHDLNASRSLYVLNYDVTDSIRNT